MGEQLNWSYNTQDAGVLTLTNMDEDTEHWWNLLENV
jgi:hypothetical protein